MAMLEVQGLVKIYGSRRVVDGVDFEVHRGEIVGLLGPNGAGKDHQLPHDLRHDRAQRRQGHPGRHRRHPLAHVPPGRARADMGYLAQESSVFRKLTVEKNLLGVMEMIGRLDARARRRRCDELLDQFDIARLRKSLAISLSGGERRRLEIARALVSDPQIILLDEPFTGIDPVTIASIQKIIRRLREQGIAILITDHQVRETLQITDRSYVVDKGKVLCHGTPSEVLAHPEARRRYFGEDMSFDHAGPPAPHHVREPRHVHEPGHVREPGPASSTPRITRRA